MSGSRTVLLAYAGSGRLVLCKKETAGEGSSDGGRRMCGVGRSSMDHRSGKEVLIRCSARMAVHSGDDYCI